MQKVMVVTRFIHGSRPVASAVILPDNTVDDAEHYLQVVADEHIREISSKFPEFVNANWYCDILETS